MDFGNDIFFSKEKDVPVLSQILRTKVWPHERHDFTFVPHSIYFVKDL